MLGRIRNIEWSGFAFYFRNFPNDSVVRLHIEMDLNYLCGRNANANMLNLAVGYLLWNVGNSIAIPRINAFAERVAIDRRPPGNFPCQIQIFASSTPLCSERLWCFESRTENGTNNNRWIISIVAVVCQPSIRNGKWQYGNRSSTHQYRNNTECRNVFTVRCLLLSMWRNNELMMKWGVSVKAGVSRRQNTINHMNDGSKWPAVLHFIHCVAPFSTYICRWIWNSFGRKMKMKNTRRMQMRAEWNGLRIGCSSLPWPCEMKMYCVLCVHTANCWQHCEHKIALKWLNFSH